LSASSENSVGLSKEQAEIRIRDTNRIIFFNHFNFETSSIVMSLYKINTYKIQLQIKDNLSTFVKLLHNR
jgi:hypothetical protein